MVAPKQGVMPEPTLTFRDEEQDAPWFRRSRAR